MDDRRIIIIEDEKKIADTLKMGLTENGFEVEVAYDGKIGQQLLLSRPFDLAINVWDVDFNTNTNVIDVYISDVRNKVDKGFEQKIIQTHVGMGYILKTQPG
jgi:DNA-binding response OmpR family regulator